MQDTQIAEIVQRVNNLSPGSEAKVDAAGTHCIIECSIDGLYVGQINAMEDTVDAACKFMPNQAIKGIVADALYG